MTNLLTKRASPRTRASSPSVGHELLAPYDPATSVPIDDVTPAQEQLRRFDFGENWREFLALVDESRIGQAERSLTEMLGSESLAGKTFLDVGCGSGLFSLAGLRMGATQVCSFDFDVESVECARELRRRFRVGSNWEIEQGDILDQSFVATLGTCGEQSRTSSSSSRPEAPCSCPSTTIRVCGVRSGVGSNGSTTACRAASK